MKMPKSQWGKDVYTAVLSKGITLKQLAEKLGYSVSTVSSVINGRYSNASYQAIAEKINEELGTKGLPERIDMPSDEWCAAVAAGLKFKHINIKQLAEKLDFSVSRLSLVINGKMMNEEIVSAVSGFLDITLPAVPSGDN